MSNAPADKRPPEGPEARLDELRADLALFGLGETETVELRRLNSGQRVRDDASYERVVAATLVATAEAAPLPEALRERLLDDAEAMRQGPLDAPLPVTPTAGNVTRRWTAVLLPAIAAGLIAVAWLGPTAGGPSIAERRLALLQSDPAAVTLAWQAQDDPSLAADGDGDWGDVVWSDTRQEGYLRFRGLQPNDSSIEQYQLWVFDAERDDRYPVDGGVFDIAASGEQIVPIDARLAVAEATLFAVTVERPGGVVVSDRSRLPLLASR